MVRLLFFRLLFFVFPTAGGDELLEVVCGGVGGGYEFVLGQVGGGVGEAFDGVFMGFLGFWG